MLQQQYEYQECSKVQGYSSIFRFVFVIFNIQYIGCQAENASPYGGQSCLRSVELGKENETGSPPPPPNAARSI